jgi:hypothetical protein
LVQVVLNLDELSTDPQAAAALKGADAVFCALGTTRVVSRHSSGMWGNLVVIASRIAGLRSCAVSLDQSLLLPVCAPLLASFTGPYQ